MPNPPKKRLEKTNGPSAPVSNQKFYCCRCGTAFSRQKGYFPVSHSPMYRGSGYLPMCSDCVDELYEHYRNTLGSDREAMRRMCMKLDMYWSDSIYAMVEKTAGVNSRVRSYIAKTNIIRYIDKTYDDTIREEAIDAAMNSGPVISDTNSETTGQDEDNVITTNIVEFWGSGYDAAFYRNLEKRFAKWTKGLGELSPVQEALYKQVCLNEELIARRGAKGEVDDKATKNLMDALSSLNIKPSQTKNDAADAELDKMPLGVGIQTWEFSRPLPETSEDLKDKNHRIRDITTWFLGHACKMVGLRNSYCRLYEEAMEELRVKRPELSDEDDDSVLYDIFGSENDGGSS